jgi:predicted nucleotidyltransferase
MLENFSNNDLKNIIDSAYRRFLLRSCNERISLFEFVFKLKISPQKLNLYNKKKLDTMLSKFNYDDFYLRYDEVEYLKSIEYNYHDFDGRAYTYNNFEYMSEKDINGCYNRFLLRRCRERLSMYFFAAQFIELSPQKLELYNKEAIFNFFKYFQYVDYELNENEKQFLISNNIDIRPWNFPIINHNIMIKYLNWSEKQNKSPNGSKRSMSISSNERDEEDEECSSSYEFKQENMEKDTLTKKIEDIKTIIINHLSEYVDDKIKKKIIYRIFYKFFNIHELKCNNAKEQNILIKKKNELESKLFDIKENIKKYETDENKEVEYIEDIKINILNISFDKLRKSDNKFWENGLLFNLYYEDSIKPEWMENSTKYIIDNRERFNKEILDYIKYITSDEEIKNKREKTISILNDCIHKKFNNWKVLLFGSVAQGISTIFSDLDFEIIFDEKDETLKKKVLNMKKNKEEYVIKNMEINYLKYISDIIKDDFSTSIIEANVPIIQAICDKTNIKMDISVNRDNGYKDSNIIKDIILKHIILKQAIIILKIYLKVKRLNCTVKGGISSFLLFHLVYYFFKDKEIKQKDYEKIKILDFLVDFLFFYSEFKNKKYSLLISKNDVKILNKIGENELSVASYLQNDKIDEDCENENEIKKHDIGRKCKIFSEIQKSFKDFYDKINLYLNEEKFSLLYGLKFPKKKL